MTPQERSELLELLGSRAAVAADRARTTQAERLARFWSAQRKSARASWRRKQRGQLVAWSLVGWLALTCVLRAVGVA